MVSYAVNFNDYKHFITRIDEELLQAQEHLNRTFTKFVHGTSNFRLRQELGILNKQYDNLINRIVQYGSLHRQKRSLLPIVGSALSFLFGTISDGDLHTIRRNIQTISNNQMRMKHIVAQSLTVLNVTRLEVSQNRKAINRIVSSLLYFENTIDNITSLMQQEINRMDLFIHLYYHLEISINEIKMMIQQATVQMEQLNLQLNMLSLGPLLHTC